MRKDLGMSPGKMMAQAAHAAAAVERVMVSGQFLSNVQGFRVVGWWKDWVQTGETVITLRVESEEQLEALHLSALRNNLPTTVILDAGHTEVAAGTKTCAIIGPAPEREIDAITGHLKLF